MNERPLPGDVVTVFANWTLDDEPMSPGSVSLSIRNPAGESVEVPPIEADDYTEFDVEIPRESASSGTWRFGWEGTPPVRAVREGSFEVAQSYFLGGE